MVMKYLTAAVRYAYGDLPQVMENNTYSRATTPEQIIVAAVLESFKLDMDKWTACKREYNHGRRKMSDPEHLYYKYNGDLNNKSIYYLSGDTIWLRNSDKKIDVEIKARDFNTWAHCKVDGVSVPKEHIDVILAAWDRIQGKIRRIEEAAAKAKALMEQNEAAWNLAERLLNMKRNEQGALVPIVDVKKLEADKATQVAQTGGIVNVFEENMKELDNVSHSKSAKRKQSVRSR